jgi:hypothetical protein
VHNAQNNLKFGEECGDRLVEANLIKKEKRNAVNRKGAEFSPKGKGICIVGGIRDS